eukprot:11290059-Karenia_brevis.AAC.1
MITSIVMMVICVGGDWCHTAQFQILNPPCAFLSPPRGGVGVGFRPPMAFGNGGSVPRWLAQINDDGCDGDDDDDDDDDDVDGDADDDDDDNDDDH